MVDFVMDSRVNAIFSGLDNPRAERILNIEFVLLLNNYTF